MPSTPRAASRRISRRSSTVQAISSSPALVAGAGQTRGDHRVIGPDRPHPQVRRPATDVAWAAACGARSAPRSRPAWPTGCEFQSRVTLGTVQPTRSPGSSWRSSRRLETSIVEIEARSSQVALARAPPPPRPRGRRSSGRSRSRPASSGARVNAEHLARVSGSRRRRRPSRGRPAAGRSPAGRRRGASRRRRTPSGRSTSSSIISTPADRRLEALEGVPGERVGALVSHA